MSVVVLGGKNHTIRTLSTFHLHTHTHSHTYLKKQLKKCTSSSRNESNKKKWGAPSMNFCGSLTSTSMSTKFGGDVYAVDVCVCLASLRLTQLRSSILAPQICSMLTQLNVFNLLFHAPSRATATSNPSLCLHGHRRRRRRRHSFGCGLLSVCAFGGSIECTFFQKLTANTSFADLIDVIETEKKCGERTKYKKCGFVYG